MVKFLNRKEALGPPPAVHQAGERERSDKEFPFAPARYAWYLPQS
jgi:hypothetical protein